MRMSARIELEPDRLGGPAIGSLMLHVGIVGAIALYVLLLGHFHGGIWGNNESAPGAIQATLVSSAPTIPLPSENKPTENVLATQTPSQAPALPAPEKTVQSFPLDAIPIPEKQKQPRLLPPGTRSLFPTSRTALTTAKRPKQILRAQLQATQTAIIPSQSTGEISARASPGTLN